MEDCSKGSYTESSMTNWGWKVWNKKNEDRVRKFNLLSNKTFRKQDIRNKERDKFNEVLVDNFLELMK